MSARGSGAPGRDPLPPQLLEESRARLRAIFAKARSMGYVGSGSLDRHMDHAMGFAYAVEVLRTRAPTRGLEWPARVADLGSGAGIPGLILAEHWRQQGRPAVVVLLEVHKRRAVFLAEAAALLGLVETVHVLEARAEEAGRAAEHRFSYDVVVSRAFGRPAVTAECGAPLLRPAGVLIVSEPPEEPAPGTRWPAAPLVQLGLGSGERFVHPGERRDEGTVEAWQSSGFRILERVSECSDRYPRRVGVPAKHPLF